MEDLRSMQSLVKEFESKPKTRENEMKLKRLTSSESESSKPIPSISVAIKNTTPPSPPASIGIGWSPHQIVQVDDSSSSVSMREKDCIKLDPLVHTHTHTASVLSTKADHTTGLGFFSLCI